MLIRERERTPEARCRERGGSLGGDADKERFWSNVRTTTVG
uniref:Uncharacterized protein n=1 Tax=Arundo donax TaxID=35708 RepID=A0A0A9CPQ7_ARUDO